MQKLAVLSLAGLAAIAPGVPAQQITVDVGALAGPSWRADDVTLTYLSPSELRLDVATVRWAGRLAATKLQVYCSLRLAASELHCERGRFSATLPGWGRLQGTLQGAFGAAESWHARLEVPRRGLLATLEQSAADLKLAVRVHGQKAQDLRQLAAAFGQAVPGALTGQADLTLRATLGAAATTASLEIDTRSLSYQEPSGRYAAENLAAHGRARWDSRARRWTVQAQGRGGQVYAEPLFLDFTALPTTAELVARDSPDHWRVEGLHIRQGSAGTLEATGLISKASLRLESAELAVDAAVLAPLFATDVQPFLIGTPLAGLTAEGAARGTLSLRGGRPTALAAELSEVALDAGRLGLAVAGLTGQVHWAPAGARPSFLQWRAGSIGRIPLGPSAASFRVQGGDFELLTPWRQPLLEGALRVQRLALRKLGLPQPDADFRAVLEPIDLTALCRALDWPLFGGTLGGQLPGLRVRNEVWSIDGALEAQVFDGTIRLENLRAIEPFGVLPRVSADIRLRRLDLEAITGTFEFGRITGRLDGDVEALRLLDWKPVAFDARLYSTPGDRSPRRISQRAIDNISAIGGGPTGLLSRGFMSLFEAFSYDRLGIACVLRDGRCRMDGIEPAPPHDGQAGYYLVKGRSLPRIDMIGYTREVSWDTLVRQVAAALASGGPQTQ